MSETPSVPALPVLSILENCTHKYFNIRIKKWGKLHFYNQKIITKPQWQKKKTLSDYFQITIIKDVSPISAK